MTSAPSVSISREVTDRSESIVGINAAGKGSQVLQRTDVVMEAELVELTPDQLTRIHPGLAKADWISDTHAKLNIGTGNAAFQVYSLTPGVAGNSTNIVVSTPAGATTSATFATNTLTIAPKTAETAKGMVEALNANYASVLTAANVQLGLPSTSDGSGTLLAATTTPLAGGAAGTRMGYRMTPQGFFKSTDYKRNLCLCLEGDNQDLLHIWRIDNAFQTDDLDVSADDAGDVSGVSVSFQGHVTEANYDSTLGVYLPPYAIYVADLAASA